METLYKCILCDETENLHFNYDWSKAERPVLEYICNNCGLVTKPFETIDQIIKSKKKEGWDSIFETIEKDLHNELPNRVKNYLRNVYKVPEKTNVPYVSDDFQIGPDGAYEHTEESEGKGEYPELEGTNALCHGILWDEIYDEFSTEQFPPFGGPFNNSVSFIDWLKQNYKSPERI